MAESFFATLEHEVLNRRRFDSQAEARMANQWLEGWYNPHRRHSALGLLVTDQLREEDAVKSRLDPKS